MDLPAIGAHCSLKECSILDLLPIKCACEHLYCRDHISPDAHECPVQLPQSRDRPNNASSSTQRLRCALTGCSKLSLESFVAPDSLPSDVQEATESTRTHATCQRCQGAFCAEHRYPDAHNCTVPEIVAPPKNPEARRLLEKHFPKSAVVGSSAKSAPRRTATGPPKDPAKLEAYRKIELMKMRRTAKPGEPARPDVNLDAKVFVKVTTTDASKGEKVFWFRKDIGTGRALDVLAKEFELPSTQAHQFLQESPGSGEQTSLRNDKPLGEQITEGLRVIIAPLSLSNP